MPWPCTTSRQRTANKTAVKSCKGKAGSTGSVSQPLAGAGRIPEVEGGWSLHPVLPSSFPALLALFLSLCAHSFHETGIGEQGEGRRGGGGCWCRCPSMAAGQAVGSQGSAGAMQSHAARTSISASLCSQGGEGEYWISLWSGLNL